MGLTGMREAFAYAYVGEANFNGTKAGEIAGYKQPRQEAVRLLKDPDVRKLIDELMIGRTLGRNEVLARLTSHARADIGDYIDNAGNVDIEKLKAANMTHLIKKVKRTERDGFVTFEVELHDQQAALVHLGKHYALFTEKHEVSGALTWRELLEQAAAENDSD